MKKDINHFLRNVEKWSNILNQAVFTSQDFKSIILKRAKGIKG